MDDKTLAKWLLDGASKIRETHITGHLPPGFNFWLASDALTALLALIKELTLAIGDDPGCRKLTVPCTCGKASKLTAAHQRGAYIVRAIEPISSQSQKDK